MGAEAHYEGFFAVLGSIGGLFFLGAAIYQMRIQKYRSASLLLGFSLVLISGLVVIPALR